MGNCFNKFKKINFEEEHDKNVKLQDITEIDIIGKYETPNLDILSLKSTDHWNKYSLFQPDKQICNISSQTYKDIHNLQYIDNNCEFDLKNFSKTLEKTLLEFIPALKIQNTTSKQIVIKKSEIDSAQFEKLSPKLKSFTELGDYPVKLQIVFLKFNKVNTTNNITLGNEEKIDNMTNVFIQQINYNSDISYNVENQSFIDCIEALKTKKKTKYENNTVCVKYVFDKNDQIEYNFKNLFKKNLMCCDCIHKTVTQFGITIDTNLIDCVDKFFQNKKQFIENNIPETAFVLSCLLLSLKNNNMYAFDYLCLALISPNNDSFLSLNANYEITKKFSSKGDFYKKVFKAFENYKDNFELDSIIETQRNLKSKDVFLNYLKNLNQNFDNKLTLWADKSSTLLDLVIKKQKIDFHKNNPINLNTKINSINPPQITSVWIRKLKNDKTFNEYTYELPSKLIDCLVLKYNRENKELFLRNNCFTINYSKTL